ncbi:MAG TPA: excinuclease ABC subunit UvrC [Ignavibacteria bacterium]|nr:excinuclease ABC subunit UvrC [Ignavibacteria bacterium]HMR39818.1 excinuclease ABC subunit UvrC [Ignavibacteria bacterium]
MSDTIENTDSNNPVNKPASLEQKLKNLPSGPGVYQFRDVNGKLLYVGKAKVLKNRVRQYFQNKPVSGMLGIMISKISDLEVITTDNEIEALILENNLIKSLKPRYNINLKDDKSYPYIVITNEPFPRVFPTRQKRSDGSRYFGPYTDVKNMRYALKTIRDIFMIRSCSLNLTEETIAQNKFSVCLDYHIHKCEAPCVGYVLKKEYNDMIDEVAKLLNGKTKTLIKELTEKMNKYSGEMQFEKAAGLRDRLNAIEVYSSKQKMVDDEIIDRDIFAYERSGNDGCGMILKIRDGKVTGKTHYFLSNVEEKTDSEILENLITNHYTKTDFIPDELFLMSEIENETTLKKWLEEKKHGKIDFVIPKIGDKYKLVFMVKKNARLLLDELILTKMKREFIPPSVDSLMKDLRLTKLPRRIECFDISHIQGTDTVASMVVFVDGKPRKSDYRKFKINNVTDETGMPDDFMSMREVIYRRYKRIAEGVIPGEVIKEEDESFNSKPDLIIVDGGKGQLSSAVKVLDDLNIKDQNIIGLAKRLEEVYMPHESIPQNIPKTSSGLRLLQRVRDEAHRFAVTYHRSIRNKRTLTTELTEIEGIGDKTAQKLLIEFGSVENLKKVLKNNVNIVERSAGKKVAGKLKEWFE